MVSWARLRPSVLLTARLVVGLLADFGGPTTTAGADRESWQRFQATPECLRQEMKIPGLSRRRFGPGTGLG
jgi:hypothetical protein